MSDRAIDHTATARELEQRLRESQDECEGLRRHTRRIVVAIRRDADRRARRDVWAARAFAAIVVIILAVALHRFASNLIAERHRADYWQHAADELLGQRDTCWGALDVCVGDLR